MPAGVRMFAGMPVRRAVAAKRHATSLARPQMHPVAPDLHTLFAFAPLRLLDRRDRIQMRTTSVGHDSNDILFALTNPRNAQKASVTEDDVHRAAGLTSLV